MILESDTEKPHYLSNFPDNYIHLSWEGWLFSTIVMYVEGIACWLHGPPTYMTQYSALVQIGKFCIALWNPTTDIKLNRK